MHITEERLGAVFDLRYLEPIRKIKAGLFIRNTNLERTCQAALTTSLIAIARTARVWEGESWWASSAHGRFVDVRRGICCGFVFTAEAIQTDVVADLVLLAVNAERIVPDCALWISKYSIS